MSMKMPETGSEILSLPSLPSSDERLLPRTSGVYFVLDVNDVVLYGGQPGNIRSRWLAHDQLNALREVVAPRIHWCECEADELIKAEDGCIYRFRPALNLRPTTTERSVRLDEELVAVGIKFYGFTEEEVHASLHDDALMPRPRCDWWQ